jgi:hypothetical protein
MARVQRVNNVLVISQRLSEDFTPQFLLVKYGRNSRFPFLSNGEIQVKLDSLNTFVCGL